MNGIYTSRSSMNSSDRKLRLRELLQNLVTIEDDTSDTFERIEKTKNTVHEVKNLGDESSMAEKAMHPGEGFLDSCVLRTSSDLAVRYVSSSIVTYDRHELAQHIKENPEYWTLMFPLEVPSVAYMYGTFEPQQQQQQPRAPRKCVERQQAAPLKVPENVHKMDKTEEDSEVVKQIFSFIEKSYRKGGHKPLSYFHVVLDPDSFSRTIENIYHVSFLARDGAVAIELDSGLPFIKPMSSKDHDRGDISDEKQFIVSIDTQRWKELIEAFDIRKPLMILKKH